MLEEFFRQENLKINLILKYYSPILRDNLKYQLTTLPVNVGFKSETLCDDNEWNRY